MAKNKCFPVTVKNLNCEILRWDGVKDEKLWG